MPHLPPTNALVIRAALDDARSGRATLVQLATAHEMAVSEKLNGCVAELRQHIVRLVAPPVEIKRPCSMTLFGDLVRGVVSGYIIAEIAGYLASRLLS